MDEFDEFDKLDKLEELEELESELFEEFEKVFKICEVWGFEKIALVLLIKDELLFVLCVLFIEETTIPLSNELLFPRFEAWDFKKVSNAWLFMHDIFGETTPRFYERIVGEIVLPQVNMINLH